MAPQTKEISLDKDVREDIGKVQLLIRDSQLSPAPTGSEEYQKLRERMLPSSALTRNLSGSTSTTFGSSTLYQVILDELSLGTRNTPTQLELIDAYENAVSIFRTTALALRTEMDTLTLEQKLSALTVTKEKLQELRIGGVESSGDVNGGVVENKKNQRIKHADEDELAKQITEAVFFSNRYALYFAGQVGLAMLNSEKANIKNLFTFGGKSDASQDRDDLTRKLAGTVAEDLQRVLGDKSSRQEKLGDEDLKYTLEAVFTSWSNQFQWGTFAELGKNSGIEKVKLRWKGYSVQAGEFKKSYDTIVVDEKFMKAKRDDVIGNEDYKTQVWQSLLRLAGYDFEHQDNPFSPPGVIFTYGAPGGGKTMTAHALIRSFAEEICAKQKIPFWAFTHSITDFGSKYQNETPQQLAAIRDKVRDFPGLVVMYASDVDTIFTSRKSDNTSNEENKVSGVYFSFFDGSMIPRNGRFLAIMDANYVDGIDDATKSRVFDKIIELKRFQTAVEFAEYSRRYLSRGEQLGVKDGEWQEIGKYLLDSPLSNREISNILKNLQGDFNVTEEMLGKGREEKLAFRRDYLQGITKDTVIGRCGEFISTKMEIERASYEAKRGQDLERYLTALATEAEKTAKDTGAA